MSTTVDEADVADDDGKVDDAVECEEDVTETRPEASAIPMNHHHTHYRYVATKHAMNHNA